MDSHLIKINSFIAKLSAKILFFILLSVTYPGIGFCDIYQCNGIITNRPCENSENSRKILVEKNKDPEVEKKIIEEKKRNLWLEDLNLAKSKLQREYNIKVETFDIEEMCAKSTLLECSKAVVERKNEISKLSQDHQKIVEAESTKDSPTPDPNINNQNNVIIIDNRDSYFIHRHRKDKDFNDKLPEPYETPLLFDEGPLPLPADVQKKKEEFKKSAKYPFNP